MRRLLQVYAFSCALAVAQQAGYRYGYEYGSYPVAPGGLMPRFLIDKSEPIVKRDRECEAGTHNCLDVGFSDGCCDDDSYCYINKQGGLKCCPVGSNCVSDSHCGSAAFFCTQTVTASGTAAAQEGCCNRKCPQTSHYLCPSSLGGICCPYGAECRAGGECVAPATTSRSAVLTPIASGCTTSQFRCEDGEGCCDNWQHCTQVSGTGFCAPGNPSDTSITIVDDPNSKSGGGGGLSDGAKAGIGVGAVVGTSLIVGCITWLCISKRNQRRERTMTQETGEGHGGDGMTDITSVSRNRPRRGLTQDYFGPDAIPGPFTETALSDTTSPGPERAVPTQPQGPGDITAPVEIDSTAIKDTSAIVSPLENSGIQPTPTMAGRFELYGSDMPTRSSSSMNMLSPSLTTGQTPRDESSSNPSPRSGTPRPELVRRE